MSARYLTAPQHASLRRFGRGWIVGAYRSRFGGYRVDLLADPGNGVEAKHRVMQPGTLRRMVGTGCLRPAGESLNGGEHGLGGPLFGLSDYGREVQQRTRQGGRVLLPDAPDCDALVRELGL